MPEITGPYRFVGTAEGGEAPWYVIPFDRHGHLQAPHTRQLLLDNVANGGFTDVVIFSHGWNNDWETARDRYEHFIGGFTRMRKEHRLAVRAGYRPLLIGIIWPGTALVMPWEQPPRFAAGRPVEGPTTSESEERHMVEDIAAELPEADRARFYELLDEPGGLDETMALELATMLVDLGGKHDELPGAPPSAAAELVGAWREASKLFPTEVPAGPVDETAYGTIDGAYGDIRAAGLLDHLDPRKVVRLATVLQMKDRAGVVGGRGVAPLLGDLLETSEARVHLVGHSYGAKVVLSAVSRASLPRPVASALLLQPAVSRFCFAADAGSGHPGGFRVALARTHLPVMTTFSRRDAPLSRFFHLAARRSSDVGEIQVAGGANSRYGALGGFGPGGLAAGEVLELPMRPIGQSYDLGARTEEVLALEAHDAIRGHGEISNGHTWWALYELMAAS